jgi:hypothetical protein
MDLGAVPLRYRNSHEQGEKQDFRQHLDEEEPRPTKHLIGSRIEVGRQEAHGGSEENDGNSEKGAQGPKYLVKALVAREYEGALHAKQDNPTGHRQGMNQDQRHDLVRQGIATEAFPLQVEAAKSNGRDDRHGSSRQNVEEPLRLQ